MVNYIFFNGKAASMTWMDKPGLPGTFAPPLFFEEGDFPPSFNPTYKRQILDMVKAAKENDFGFLAWTSWPQKTEAYMYNNLAAVWLGQVKPAEYLAETQKVFDEDLKSGRVTAGPEPRT